MLAVLMLSVLGLGFSACSSDDDDLGLSENQIREYLESGSGTWKMSSVDDNGHAWTSTWVFRNGMTNGVQPGDFSFWATKYSVKGNLIYIADEDANAARGDILEGGVYITKLTNTTFEGYRRDDKSERYTGVKVE